MASLALAFDILARDKASKTFDKVGDSADRAGKKGGGFGRAIAGGAKVAALGLAGVGIAAVAGLGAFVKDAAESAKIGRLTEAVIKSTGGAAKITASQVGDLATAISNKTGVDDEAIQAGENLLLTFTNIRNEAGKGNDIFNRATQTITDMSAALGQDTKASAIQLGKALNDPVKGVTALSKVGVSFTQQQKDQIKTLVKSGKTLDAQKVILNELGKEFGGAAAAASDPMTKLQVIVGNLGEKIGGFLLPYIGQFAEWVGGKAIPAVEKFVDWLGPKLSPVVAGAKDLIDQVVLGVMGLIDGFKFGEVSTDGFAGKMQQLGVFIAGVTGFVKEHSTVIGAMAVAVGTAVGVWKAWTIGVAAWAAVTKAAAAVQVAFNAVMNANPIGIIIVAVAALAAGLIYAYKHSETFRNVVDTGIRAVGNVFIWLWNKAIAPALRFIIGGFGTLIDWVGNLLDALSNVPGFGWAKDAAAKMHNAANKAHEMADGIRDIPALKEALVRLTTEEITIKRTIVQNQQQRVQSDIRDRRGYATGTTSAVAGVRWVGERGPELVDFRGGEQVYTAGQSRRLAAAAAQQQGGLSDRDIQRIAEAVRQGSYAGTTGGRLERDRNVTLSGMAGR